MFTEQKWNILKCLSEQHLSPLQLSERLDSTMANISHQLKLLEAANLVEKKKIKNRDKGKPRSLFSLTDDYVFLVPTMKNFAGKKLLRVTEHHKIMLRIWFLQNESLHYPLEKLYWNIEKQLHEVDAIYADEEKSKIFVVTKNDALKKRIQNLDCGITVTQSKKSLSLATKIFDRSSVETKPIRSARSK